jgi:diguanylate cyclase (GGDEF)-like protein
MRPATAASCAGRGNLVANPCRYGERMIAIAPPEIEDRRRRFPGSFSVAVLASVLLVFLASIGLAMGLFLLSANDIDRSGLDTQTQRVAHALAIQLQQLPREQSSVTIWDDAVRAIADGDNGWLDSNIGSWMYEYFQHDISLIYTKGAIAPALAWDEGSQVELSALADDYPPLRPLVEELRMLASRGYADTPPQISDFVDLPTGPALVSLTPVVTDSGRLAVRAGDEPVLVSIVNLDLDYELRLIDKYLVDAGRFTTEPPTNHEANLPVTNRAGRIVTFFQWEAYRPGELMLRSTAPALVGVILLVSGMLTVLLIGLWRSSRALEGRRNEAERLANQDALTGLPNRLSFEAQFQRALDAPRRSSLGLLMLDLDRFKQVNDTLGHQAGDTLIRSMAFRLSALLRPGEVIGRLGGDEFALMARRRRTELQALATEIIESVRLPFRLEGTDAFVGVSIGVVVLEADETDQLDIMRRADIALYEAKASGRNRAVFYDGAMDERVQGRHRIEAELREALASTDQLWVAYQPLFRADSSRPVGAEALVRWKHPRLGQVPPAEFIGVAETSGLIEALGEYVLRETCRMGARWPGRSFAVNVSAAQFRHPGFGAHVLDVLHDAGMQAQDLELEITESILLDEQAAVVENLRTLQLANVRLAIDDFGTGYSSLNYLRRYPVDRIKIDRSFVAQVADIGSSRPIVEAMVRLTDALGIEVTAEGVETREQFERLREMGCTTFQGYLFGAPLRAEELERLWAPSGVAQVA